jgi:hypothetical protein
VHPLIQTLFPSYDSVFQDDSALHSHTWNSSVMVLTWTSSRLTQSHLKYHWTTLVSFGD